MTELAALAKIRQLERVAAAVRTSVVAGANAYANGVAGGKPIVDKHFTAGNQQRYGWAALSRDYFLRKQGQIKPKTKGGVFFPGLGKTGSKLDKAAEFRSSTGLLSGIGVGINAPMLVLTGALRAAVSSVKHPVRASPDGNLVTVKFSGLPEYAQYLHDGTPRMPQRSPVAPNELDRAEIVAVMRKHVDAALGTGGAVPVSSGPIPGRARIV